MSQKYKLTYFNARGRAEVIRLIFAQAGVKYEDLRLEREEFLKYKAKTPNGKVPILDIEGTVYCQSNAICRYLAKQFGLHAKCPLDELRLDMIVDSVEDMITPFIAFVLDPDEEIKAAAKKKFEEEQYPSYLQKLESLLISNNGGDGYFVGKELTWADLMFFNWASVAFLDEKGFSVDMSKVPKLEALIDRVKKQPRIADWLEKRPRTPF